MSTRSAVTLPNRPILHVADIAIAAGVCKKTVRRAIQSGKFPGPTARVGRRMCWPRATVLVALGLTAEVLAVGVQ